MPPNKKPYAAIAVAGDDFDDDGVDDIQVNNTEYHDSPAGENGSGPKADLPMSSNLNLQQELPTTSQCSATSRGCSYMLVTCLLAFAIVSGRNYYLHNYGSGSSSAVSEDGVSKGIRGSDADYSGTMQDQASIERPPDLDFTTANGPIEIENANKSSEEVEDPGDMDEVGEAEAEERKGGEKVSDLDDDVKDEQQGGENQNLSPSLSVSSSSDYNAIEDVAEPEHSVTEDKGEINETTESPSEAHDLDDVAAEPEISSPEVPDITKDEKIEDQELLDKATSIEEETPDYFVPLTTEEREDLKNRLRATVLLTKSSLVAQATKQVNDSVDISPHRTLLLDPQTPKQFMHMHHMKTGGTSMDTLIHCALRRQRDVNYGVDINYQSLSECGSRVRVCMENLADELNASVIDNVFFRNDDAGNPVEDERFDPADESLNIPIDDLNVCSTAEANVMSYCASLHAVRTFGWKDVDKITVIRNPIDRAWSMYRFTLQSCYDCQPMSDVLERVANGTFSSRRSDHYYDDNLDETRFVYSPNDSCAVQMIGHQATNLLSSLDLYNVANDVRFPREKEIAEEAVRNLREEFTWIGLTDRLEESTDAFREVFPFLTENLSEEAKRLEEDMRGHGLDVPENPFGLPETYGDLRGCPLEHANAGRDPTCGTKEMDDYTISLIKKLSNRDVAVYKAAVERFEIQMEVLEEFKNWHP
mmetsp:Transcript_472/g.956  ORF Transcript_472/g.956 Transcript_472/m.956 type:complete len:702 (+) Transcript_472:98-2203(+)